MEKDQNRLRVRTLIISNLSISEIRQWVAFQFGEPTHEVSKGNIGSLNNPFTIKWTVNSGEKIDVVTAIQFSEDSFALNFFSQEHGIQREIEIARL